MHEEFHSEGASYGDFDRDGDIDVVAGPYWYEGPELVQRHELYTPLTWVPTGYSRNFFAFVHDFNADEWPDVLVVGFPGEEASWYENPQSNEVHWPRHVVFTGVDTESPTFTDLTGDGLPELVCANGGRLGWIAPSWSAPESPWTFHALSPPLGFYRFTHGLGVGDVDGDNRLDVLEATAWWKQPISLAGDPEWTRHEHAFGEGGAQMFAVDVDGDADQDVIATLAAHDYGAAWFEQTATGFTERRFAAADPSDTASGPVIFEPHAMAVSDIDLDGLQDVITGERFWGHVPEGAPDFDAPATLWWFRLEREKSGARFVPHLIDDASGVGTQVMPGDVNADELVDIVVANKKGAFVFLQRVE